MLALIAVCAIPFAFLLFILRQSGYSWTSSLALAALFPACVLASFALKLRAVIAELRTAVDRPVKANGEEETHRVQQAVKRLIAEGYLNRGELEKSKQAAHAKPPALRSWFKADLDKAQTHADRERVMKEVQRRMK
jgi:hypothetical protein